jgi:hypothetical protein
LYYILIFSFLIPLFVYIILRKRILNDKRIVIAVLYSIVIFLFLFFDLFDPPIQQKLKDTLYTIIEFSFFTILIYQQVKSINVKRSMKFLYAFFILLQVIHYFTVKKIRLDSIPIGVETILIFVFLMLYFYEQLKNEKEFFFNKNYFYLIAIGLLIYLGGSFFIYLLANNLDYDELSTYWPITYVVELIKNVLFTVAIVRFANEKTKKKNSNTNKPLPNLDFTL